MLEIFQRTSLGLGHYPHHENKTNGGKNAVYKEGAGIAQVLEFPRKYKLHAEADRGIYQADK